MLVVAFNRSHARIISDYMSRSLFYCLFMPHNIWVSFFTHILFVVNCTFNATLTEGLQQHPLQALFHSELHHRTFFLWRLHLARPSHLGHSTTLLLLENPSDMCAKRHTMAASNNRDHMPWSLFVYASHYVQSFTCLYHQRLHPTITFLLLVCATYIWVSYFTHIPFMVNRTFNATLTERLQQYDVWVCFFVNANAAKPLLVFYSICSVFIGSVHIGPLNMTSFEQNAEFVIFAASSW